jgi:hypothetical protein
MKKAVLIFLKLAIFSVFLWNTGIIQLIQETEKNRPPEIERTWQEQRAFEEGIRDFWSEKYRAARAKDNRREKYSLYDYFADLTEFHLKFGGASAGLNSNINSCLALMDREVGPTRRYSSNDITVARDKYYRATGQASLTSDRQKNLKWSETLSAVSGWLVKMYLHNLIFAFLLFALWDAQRRGKLVIKNPVSLLLNAVLHPLTLTVILYQYFNTKIMESEFRRTKDKFLTVLSEDELRFLRTAIQKGLSRQEFKALLRARGLIVRHSVAWGLMATMVVMMLPTRLMAAQNYNSADKEVAQVCASSGNLVLAANSCQPDDDSYDGLGNCVVEKIFCPQIFISVLFVKLTSFFFKEIALFKRIKHIPLANS